MMALIASDSKVSLGMLAGFKGVALINRPLNMPFCPNSSFISLVAVAGRGIAWGLSAWTCAAMMSLPADEFLIFAT